MKIGAEIGIMVPQVMKCLWLSETGRGMERSFPCKFHSEYGPAATLISDFQPPELRNKISVALSHPICGILLLQSQETNTEHKEYLKKCLKPLKCDKGHESMYQRISINSKKESSKEIHTQTHRNQNVKSQNQKNPTILKAAKKEMIHYIEEILSKMNNCLFIKTIEARREWDGIFKPLTEKKKSTENYIS